MNPSQTNLQHPASTTALKAQVDTLGKDVRELGSLAKDAAVESFERTRESGAELVSSARDQVVKYEESLLSSMRANPLRTLGLAAGAGFVLGLIARR